MNKTITSFIFTLLLTVIASAQNNPTFKVVGNDINKESLAKEDRLEISKINVENTSDEPIFLKWETVYNSFPKNWDSSMCQHGACQIGIPKGSSFKKLNPDQQGFIAIHVMSPKKKGTGIVKFKIYDTSNPSYFEILTFEVAFL
ncbi:hypothetical protein SAMN04489761_4405 [Tenacibaculum sp. MAR_2009_124]|uniref:hypothetical protein n=1 Tax=Tenacibaculum sp. MAR_2009_124 TaxID=1250059 RepID=UPI000899E47B|nr:hypothetical protein [Tenacibaculum sp. MAR_2009_124]SED14158.1 hypothetical protein SAMN04489761_4405 [Tenacibaculum sp. MAR_2009_124]